MKNKIVLNKTQRIVMSASAILSILLLVIFFGYSFSKKTYSATCTCQDTSGCTEAQITELWPTCQVTCTPTSLGCLSGFSCGVYEVMYNSCTGEYSCGGSAVCGSTVCTCQDTSGCTEAQLTALWPTCQSSASSSSSAAASSSYYSVCTCQDTSGCTEAQINALWPTCYGSSSSSSSRPSSSSSRPSSSSAASVCTCQDTSGCTEAQINALWPTCQGSGSSSSAAASSTDNVHIGFYDGTGYLAPRTCDGDDCSHIEMPILPRDYNCWSTDSNSDTCGCSCVDVSDIRIDDASDITYYACLKRSGLNCSGCTSNWTSIGCASGFSCGDLNIEYDGCGAYRCGSQSICGSGTASSSTPAASSSKPASSSTPAASSSKPASSSSKPASSSAAASSSKPASSSNKPASSSTPASSSKPASSSSRPASSSIAASSSKPASSSRKYTVTFFDDEELIATRNCTTTGTSCDITSPSSPDKDGYEFAGYSPDKSCPENGRILDDVRFSVSSDATYYACWNEIDDDLNRFSAIFYDQDDELISYGICETPDDFCDLVSPPAPTKDGYEFIGYSRDKKCTDTNKLAANTTFIISSDVIYYACYNEVKVTPSSSNVNKNVDTGTAGIIIAWIVGLGAIVYGLYYFKKFNSVNS